jgi:hypothetical protein
VTWPSNYKVLDLKINLDFNEMLYERETYDILQLLGDVGGLQTALFIIVQVSFSWYSSFTKAGFIMENLFQSSSAFFKQARNIMKPSLEGLDKNLKSSSPFVLAKKKTLYFSIKEDLANR